MGNTTSLQQTNNIITQDLDVNETKTCIEIAEVFMPNEIEKKLEELQRQREEEEKSYVYFPEEQPTSYTYHRVINGKEHSYSDYKIYHDYIKYQNSYYVHDPLGPIDYSIETEKGVIQMKRGRDRLISSNSTRGEIYAKELVEQQKKYDNTRGHIFSSLGQWTSLDIP